jgi:hypothetical protein
MRVLPLPKCLPIAPPLLFGYLVIGKTEKYNIGYGRAWVLIKIAANFGRGW